MNSYFLILIIANQSMWGIPTAYPDPAQCEAAGKVFAEERVSRRYVCLPAPIVTGDTVNRRPKSDAYPIQSCTRGADFPCVRVDQQ